MRNQCYVSAAILPIWMIGVLAVLLVGCTHTRILNVSAADARAAINERASRGDAIITLDTGERVTTSRSLHVAPDVVTWIDPASDEIRSVSPSELVSVQFLSRGRGALEGLGFGFLVGTVVGAALGAAVTSDDCFTESDPCPIGGAVVGIVLFGVPSAGVGALVGVARGARYVYKVPPPGSGR